MDTNELILTEAVGPPSLLEHLSGTLFCKKIAESERSKIDGASEETKKQVAKDFESVFINKLLDEMEKTIGEWGFEKDGTSKQIQGIFWLYLARDVANNGGFGMWKDIYQFLTDSDQTQTTTESLEGERILL